MEEVCIKNVVSQWGICSMLAVELSANHLQGHNTLASCEGNTFSLPTLHILSFGQASLLNTQG